MVSIVGRSEPVLAISSFRYRGNKRQARGNYNKSNRQQFQQHHCRNCGQPWTQELRPKCQAIDAKACRRCSMPNHLARVCRSNLNRYNNRNVNEIAEQNETKHEEQINMVSRSNEIESIREDSEEDYIGQTHFPDRGITYIHNLYVKFGNTRYWVMVDSDTSNSLITERMAHEIEDKNKNSC